MSPAHKATFPAKLITGKKVILDAGWPLTDGALSRGISLNNFSKLVQSFLLDLLSFHFADKILVESHAQLKRVHRIYRIPVKRIKVSFTGVNENAFAFTHEENSLLLQNLRDSIQQSQKITVLFRGRINNEAGIERIVASARLLEKEANFIFVTGSNRILENLGSNCFTYSDISELELKQIYEISDVTIGQISHHPRLSYTIPHKAFEAGYFGKSYISPRSPGILELFSDESVYFIENASIENLVAAIRQLKDSELRKSYESHIKETYEELSSQKVLNEELERIILGPYLE
ncbi:GT4_PimA-like domain containing protein [Candidatus Nanopelagicaceae bacterium]